MSEVHVRRKRRWPRVVGIGAAVAIVGFPFVIAAVAVLIGLVAAVFGLAIAAIAVAGPWVALGYGGYYLWRRSRRKRQLQASWAAAAQRWQPPAASTMSLPPAPGASDPAERLPQEQRDQVGRIRRKAQALLHQTDSFPAGSRNLYLVQRMLGEYLPSTLDSYLALPPGAADLAVTSDGRTGIQVLRGQLDILEAKLDEAASDLWQVNVDRLLANERFLEEHFGRPPARELTIPEAQERPA